MSAMKLKTAAVELGMSVSSLRRMIAAGAPVLRRGGRGRGKAALVCPQAVEAWRAAQGVQLEQARAVVASELGAVVPEILADAVAEAFRQIEGAGKMRAAGYLAGAWYLASCALLDRLRRDNSAIPEISTLPEQINRLRKITSG